jgi:hypothetical protein
LSTFEKSYGIIRSNMYSKRVQDSGHKFKDPVTAILISQKDEISWVIQKGSLLFSQPGYKVESAINFHFQAEDTKVFNVSLYAYADGDDLPDFIEAEHQGSLNLFNSILTY